MTAARRTLVTASLGTLVTLVAFTAPLATVNLTVAGLDAGTSGRTWILSSMSIGLGAFLLTAGRVADDFGRRRTFVAGALVLALGSLLGAVSPEVVTFVIARVVQGIGGAAMLAAGLGMIAVAFPDPHARAHATGVWGASVGAGIALGPLLSAGLAKVRLLARRVRRAGGGGGRAGADRAWLRRVARRSPGPARRTGCGAAGAGHGSRAGRAHRGTRGLGPTARGRAAGRGDRAAGRLRGGRAPLGPRHARPRSLPPARVRGCHARGGGDRRWDHRPVVVPLRLRRCRPRVVVVDRRRG